MNDRIPHGFLPVTRYEEITEDFFRYYKPEETVRQFPQHCFSAAALSSGIYLCAPMPWLGRQ